MREQAIHLILPLFLSSTAATAAITASTMNANLSSSTRAAKPRCRILGVSVLRNPSLLLLIAATDSADSLAYIYRFTSTIESTIGP